MKVQIWVGQSTKLTKVSGHLFCVKTFIHEKTCTQMFSSLTGKKPDVLQGVNS